MARVAPTVPEESALLCEKCGYIVNGIPMDSLCPECAAPIAESLPETRQPPLWERAGPGANYFFMTTFQLIVSPTRFFRSMSSRGDSHLSGRFARGHYFIASIFFGLTAWFHALCTWPIIWYARPI